MTPKSVLRNKKNSVELDKKAKVSILKLEKLFHNFKKLQHIGHEMCEEIVTEFNDLIAHMELTNNKLKKKK